MSPTGRRRLREGEKIATERKTSCSRNIKNCHIEKSEMPRESMPSQSKPQRKEKANDQK